MIQINNSTVVLVIIIEVHINALMGKGIIIANIMKKWLIINANNKNNSYVLELLTRFETRKR